MRGKTGTDMDADGDGVSDRLEVVRMGNALALNVEYGDGRTLEYTLSVSSDAELLYAGAGDADGDGQRELVLLLQAAPDAAALVCLQDRGGAHGTYPALAAPDLDGPDWAFTAVFERQYVLDIHNTAGTFMTGVKLDEAVFAPLYREDGSAPATLRADVDAPEAMRMETLGDSAAVCLLQPVRYTSANLLLGVVVTKLIWQNGVCVVVGQSFEPMDALP